MLFPNTKFSVMRLHPGPKEFTNQANPKEILSMVMQCFADGEEVEIEAKGEDENLGAIVLQTVIENMTLLYTESDANTSEVELRERMYKLLPSALSDASDVERTQLFNQAKVSILQAELKSVKLPKTTYETSAILADRLHNAMVEVLPLIAQYYRSVFVLSFPKGQKQRHEEYNLSKSDDSQYFLPGFYKGQSAGILLKDVHNFDNCIKS